MSTIPDTHPTQELRHTSYEDGKCLPISASDLEIAASRFRPDPATTRALKRLLEGDWTYRNDDIGEMVIRFDPRSKGRGKKPPSAYTTKQHSCTCPGAIIRGGCYHPVAWQIVSEALLPTTTIQCALPSTLFLPLCVLALACGADCVTISIDSEHETLTLGTPDVATATIRVAVLTPVLLTIKQHVRATGLQRIIDTLTAALPPEGDQIMLELSQGSLMIVAGSEDAPLCVDGLDTLPLDRAEDRSNA